MTLSVGLTGNVGCGKSTVAAMLRDLGCEVVDADALVHAMLAEGGDGVAPTLAAFPEAAVSGGRAVDRAALARIVFDDPARRRQLERILHPLVIGRSSALIEDAARRGVEVVVTEAALVFESARDVVGPASLARFDVLVTVSCDPAVRLERFVRRHGGTRAEAEAELLRRSAAQMPQEEKARLAHHVVDNSGSPEATRAEVRVLHSRLLAAARAKARCSGTEVK